MQVFKKIFCAVLITTTTIMPLHASEFLVGSEGSLTTSTFACESWAAVTALDKFFMQNKELRKIAPKSAASAVVEYFELNKSCVFMNKTTAQYYADCKVLQIKNHWLKIRCNLSTKVKQDLWVPEFDFAEHYVEVNHPEDL